MPFGNKARSVRAYEFGCLPPVSGEKEAVDTMSARVRLWNQLVALNREYEPRREAVLEPHLPPKPADDADKEALKAYRTARHATFKRPEVIEQLCKLDKDELGEARVSAHESGLNWMNYDEVLLTWQQARRKPGSLRFHAARNEPGKITVRWQTGLALVKAFSYDTRMFMDPIPPEAYVKPIRHAQKRLLRDKHVHFRVCSDESKRPVWVDLPVFLHRPLPESSLIRQASLLREQIGLHWRWKLIIIVETAEVERPFLEGATLHVELGWAKQPDGSLRVATWRDDGGATGIVVLPARWLAAMQQCEDLQSIRDKRFNGAKAVLIAWLSDHTVPNWFREAAKTIGAWRSPRRLGALVWRWLHERFEGDDDIFPEMENFRRQERHLLEYQANSRDEALRERREIYRHFAADVAQRYAEVEVKELRLDRLARRRKRDDGYNEEANHQRFLTAPSTLRLALKNACQREGLRYCDSQKSADSTQKE